MKKPLIVIFIILLIDQIVKFWIKLNFTLGEELFLIGDWCRLHFIENEGMAFGMSFGEEVGKLILTLFRIVAATLIFFYLRKLVIKKENKLVIYAFTLIFAGAVGNIIDSLFYGLIFSESTFFTTAQLFPESGGYAPLCLGKVVDMFYFPLIDTTLPQWIPFVGGNHFEFFNAIFNVADIAITVGVGLLVVSVFVLNNKKKTISFEEIEQDTNK
ncbi:MAG: lipoprotein signal peptidase [Bacteroidales bacterium]|nr:lipoprotein signal peptidase [Bacteroidales bacterium]MEE0888778.1 lipoprotein signal peptidase [Bacteroidales bacterium]MEE1113168.1 lipoprotein signal peptidase [Bacteroidales bacterium]MEE1142506.1 lipoprotein signal peptidase [Bacteroidales bacterium]